MGVASIHCREFFSLLCSPIRQLQDHPPMHWRREGAGVIPAGSGWKASLVNLFLEYTKLVDVVSLTSISEFKCHRRLIEIELLQVLKLQCYNICYNAEVYATVVWYYFNVMPWRCNVAYIIQSVPQCILQCHSGKWKNALEQYLLYRREGNFYAIFKKKRKNSYLDF